MASDKQEIEWQFDAPDLSLVATWLRQHGSANGWHVREGGTQEITDTYFDTSQWHLFRAGYVLRMRWRPDHPVEVTLKSFGSRKAGLRSRREISELLADVTGDQSDLLTQVSGPVRQHLRTILGQRRWPDRALFSTRTQRAHFVLHTGHADLAEIALDTTSFYSGHHPISAKLVRVEVELLSPGSAEYVAHFVAQMRTACGLRPAVRSKFELGLRAHGLRPIFVPDLGKPNRAAQVGEAEEVAVLAFAILREGFARWLTIEPAVRLGEDVEAIHRGRVAIRRLRSALGLFRAHLPAEAQRYREELAWIAALMGAVRDLDVQCKQLVAWRADRAFPWADDLNPVAEWLVHQRAKAQAMLLRGLNSARYRRLVSAFARFLRAGEAAAGENGRMPIRQTLPKLIRKRHSKLRKLGDTLRRDSPLEDYHDLRIRCKRLRYALEAAEHLFDQQIRAYLSRCVALQDLLGEIQDAHIAARQMRDWAISAKPPLPPASVFALGVLAHHHVRQVDALLARFPDLYRDVRAWKLLRKAITE